MNETELTAFLRQTFPDVDSVERSGDRFFFYNPGPVPDHRMPFATLVTNDDYDRFSQLGRPGVFRLNIGVSSETYRALFGAQPAAGKTPEGYDFAALDTLFPHPEYAQMSWVCILNPTPSAVEQLKPLLNEAYGRAVQRVNRSKRREAPSHML